MPTKEITHLDVDQQDVILTPDQRLRVFISSTLEELAPERVAARKAVERLHLSTLPRVEADNRSLIIEEARTALGPTDYRLAYARGAAMSPDEVTNYVLDALTNVDVTAL